MKILQNFSFTKNFKVFTAIGGLFALTGLIGILLLPFGVSLFNLDIDFLGGTTMHVATRHDMNAAATEEVARLVEEVTGTAPSSVQQTGDGTEVIIKTLEMSSEQREAVFGRLSEAYGLTEDDMLNTENVNPSVGKDLQRAAFLSALVAVVLMLLYITVRFELKSGLSAVICLIHDLLVMLSFYIILQIPVNMTFIAAALTILGYSINASIVIFDRVRENQKAAGRQSFDHVIDLSIRQTLARSINTSLTTLLTIGMIFILGVYSLRVFSLPIIIGIIAGAYSSVCLAGPIWAKLRKAR